MKLIAIAIVFVGVLAAATFVYLERESAKQELARVECATLGEAPFEREVCRDGTGKIVDP